MGYTPYKMLGHELPGIKQRTPAQMSMEKTHINEEMVDGVSTTPGKFKGGNSPAKNLMESIRNATGGIFGRKQKRGPSILGGIAANFGGSKGGAGNSFIGDAVKSIRDMNQPSDGGGGVAPHGDEAHTGGGGGGGGGLMGGISAVGGGTAGPFSVGNALKGYEGLDERGRYEYEQQFDDDQLKRMQSHARKNKDLGWEFGGDSGYNRIGRYKGMGKRFGA